MRKSGLFCVIVAAILGLCMVSPVAGEEPGDKLVEVFKKDIEPLESLIPAGVVIEKEFKPGKGAAIGTVEAIKGQVLTIHQGEKTAYILKKKYELFTYDTLITAEKSKAHIKFNDGSFITLGAYTKLVLDKSIYDVSKTSRDSFVRLLFGKARFIVAKLVNFRSSKYKVKTPTAVVGVRGSDFSVSVAYGSPLVTTLMTGEDTTVVFAGDTGPAQIVGPMSASSAAAGGTALSPLGISAYSTTLLSVGGISSTVLYVGGAVGAGVVAGAALSSSGSNDSVAPVVTNVNPAEGLGISYLSGTVAFTFSKPMSVDSSYSLTASGTWTTHSGVWSGGDTIFTITFVDFVTSPGTMTIILDNFRDAGGILLGGQNSFDYTIF